MSEVTVALTLIGALAFKHMLCDFWWQSAWMLAGKGRWGHLGGLAHAGLHGAFSAAILALFGLPLPVIAGLALAETAVHYHIDWIKAAFVDGRWDMQDRRFWQALGVDQFAHVLTYLAMVWVACG